MCITHDAVGVTRSIEIRSKGVAISEENAGATVFEEGRWRSWA